MFSSKNSEFNILTDLNGYIQQLLDITKSENNENQQQMIQDRNPSLLRICYCVEKILSDGLKDVNFISSTTMWDFLQNLPQCLPDTQRVVELSKDCSKSSIGRGRVLIRLALNDGLLEEYISSLCFSQEVLKSYYKESALLRNSEFMMMFQSLIAMLSHIQFSLVVKDKDLDKANYWEDIALTLLTNVETRVVKRFIMVPQENQLDNGSNIQQNQNQSEPQQVQIQSIQEPEPIQVEPIQVEPVESLESTSSIDQHHQSTQLNDSKNKGMVSSFSNSLLDLGELESALSEITSEEPFSPESTIKNQQQSDIIVPTTNSITTTTTTNHSNNNIIPNYEKVIITDKDYEQWDQLIEGLIKSKKTVLLDYGAKGSAITVSDGCLEGLWLSIDKILASEFRNASTSLYSNLWSIITGISVIISVGSGNGSGLLVESNEPIEKLYQDSFKRVRAFYFKAVMSNQKVSNYFKQYFGFSKDNDSQGILIRFYKNNSIVLQYDYMIKFFNLLDDLDSSVLFKLKWDKDVQQLSLPKKVTKVIKKKVIKKTIVTVKKSLNNSGDSNNNNNATQQDNASKLMNSIDSNIQDSENQEFDEEEKKSIENEIQEKKEEVKDIKLELEQQNTQNEQISNSGSDNNISQPTPIENILNEEVVVSNEIQKQEQESLEQNVILEQVSPLPSPKEDELIEKLDKDIIQNQMDQLNESSTNPNNENKVLSSSQDSVVSIEDSQQQQQQNDIALHPSQSLQSMQSLQSPSSTPTSSTSNSTSTSTIQLESPKQEQLEELTRDKVIIERRSTLSEVMKKEKEKSSTSSSSSVSSTNNNSSNNLEEQDKDNINSEQFQNLLSSLKTSQESIEFRYKSDPTYSSYTDSYNNEPFSTSYMGSSSFTNENEALKSSLSSSLIDSCQFISEYEVSTDNKKRNKNILVGEDGQLFINQLYRTNAVKAAYYSQGTCPGCHIQLEKLGYFKTRICYYTGKYYCNNCHSNQKSLIPARILWKWEFKLFPVSDAAKSYLTRNLETPFDIFQFNPECLNLNPKLPKINSMREKLFFIGEYIESCRNTATLEIPKLNSYFVCDNVYTYSIMDLEKIYTSNTLETTIQQVMEKYINHVTKDCIICKGKGFICEYCNNDDELIFSWMSLDVQNFIKCDKCLTLSHKKCALESKDTCPKCLRIAKIKSKSNNNNNNNSVHLQIK